MRILVIDDEPEIGYTFHRALTKQDYLVEALEDFSLLSASPPYWDSFDLIFLDINMPEINGIDLLKKIRASSPDRFVVIMTAYGSEEIAVQAMKEGASDYLKKPFNIADLRSLCSRLSSQLPSAGCSDLSGMFGGIVTQSPKMEPVLKLLSKIRDFDVTVLISGESGTGKELVAQALHRAGAKAGEPFIPINCSAIPENLVESELFGFEKGSFTGASSTQLGKFELAGTGVIFLDEIGEIPLQLQAKLLRVLQEKTILRIGGSQFIPVACRIITATHQNLEAEVRKGNFREDLYYRLNVVSVALPPLRERTEDIPVLSMHFLKSFNEKYGLSWTGFADDALDFLCSYSFPGNIRELKNIIERIMVTGEGKTITLSHLKSIYRFTEGLLSGSDLSGKDYVSLKKELTARFDREYFTRLLAECNGNISMASRICGLQRKSIYEKLKELGITPAVE
ncbi:MAG: sigma-54 dependent transcriptional regulator [Candidatus Wallbacteria bacterium]|nr:sigma-54 dependent transcriptional regulator [Candidatus Wallbacteria bacterium]